MSTLVMAANYASRPAYQLLLYVDLHDQDYAGNRSRFDWALYIYHNSSASNNTYSNTARAWGVSNSAQGTIASGNANFLMGPSGDFVGKTILIGSGTTGYITHDANGYLSGLTWSAYHNMSPDIMGNASGSSGAISVPRIPKVPATPVAPTISAVVTTGFRVTGTAPDNMGAAIDTYEFQASADAFATIAETHTGAALYQDFTTLVPGVTYVTRYRAHNSQGNSAWSPTASQQTQPALYYSNGTTWLPAGLQYSDGAAWQPVDLTYSNGTTWLHPLPQ